MERIDIRQIPFDLSYQGYYWYSNETAPTVISNDKISEDIFTALPFVIEGNFYNESKQISINIKNIDGNYLVTKIDFTTVNQTNITEKDYLLHKTLDGFSKIKLVNYWQESPPDDLLEGMTTLIPVWIAFKGFVK